MRLRGLVIGAMVGVAAGFAASPAGATHADRCEAGDDPTVPWPGCLPHHARDAITGGRPAGVACALQRALGVDNVKDCQAKP